jgi:phosphoribosylanthranilate isomerase
MSIQVKICGITTLDDALDAIDFGADYLGFNFYPDSPRYIEPVKAKEIIEDIPDNIGKVGVFVNEDKQLVIDLAIELDLDLLQFHGDETPEYCQGFGRDWMKAFRLKDQDVVDSIKEYGCQKILVDAYVEKAFGGTGVMANWDLARLASEYGDLFLSGGLNPENIEIAIEAVKPYAVDVASGVESAPGIKDRDKMQDFISKVKKYTLRPKLVDVSKDKKE